MSNMENKEYYTPYTMDRKTYGLAILALINSLVGIVAIIFLKGHYFVFVLGTMGVVMGIISMFRINESPDKYTGKRIAIAGLIIGVIIIVIDVTLIV